jgi:hypothetical protein
VRDRLIWFSLAMTAAVVTGLIVVVTVAAGDSGGGASETGPIVSVDDGRLTEAQRRRATELLEDTRRTLLEFPDEASLLAAGYRSIIGPGITAVSGQIEHYFNAEYLADGRALDPGRIESLLTEGQPDGSKLVVAGMYILEPGATMADAPDIAGELTPWHDHQNLCWDESGTRYEGFLLDGKCVPGGTLKIMPPMMHVWLTSTPCGPFAGLEGHGGACRETHGHDDA